MTWARSYGKGRVFYTSMGHREDVWENPKYQGLLDRRPGLGHRQGRRQHRAQHQAGDTRATMSCHIEPAPMLSGWTIRRGFSGSAFRSARVSRPRRLTDRRSPADASKGAVRETWLRTKLGLGSFFGHRTWADLAGICLEMSRFPASEQPAARVATAVMSGKLSTFEYYRASSDLFECRVERLDTLQNARSWR